MTLQLAANPLEGTPCMTLQQTAYPLEGTPGMTIHLDVNSNAEVIRFFRTHDRTCIAFQTATVGVTNGRQSALS
jgi:hypothetical protein